MEIQTVFLIIAAAVLSLAIVLFQYFYRVKGRGRLQVLLSFFRFLALFGILILLINPKLVKAEYILEKTGFVLLTDNSRSGRNYADTIRSIVGTFKGNQRLSDRFHFSSYSFGASLQAIDSLTFDEEQTNIQRALASVNEIFANNNSIIVMVTDGNQTIGEDYLFSETATKVPVYPIVIGDTTRYEDLRIERINVNTYAFLENKFPMEVFITYEGNNTITSTYTIRMGGKVVQTNRVTLDPINNTKVIDLLLDAESVGPKTITVSVNALEQEKNTANNAKSAGIEVIDEKTNIALISNILHPDIGAFTKAIESNEQRSVTVVKPTVSEKILEETDVFILYEPDGTFKSIYTHLEQRKANFFTIAGPRTDWNFLNSIQGSYSKNGYGEQEEIFPVLNPGFNVFNIQDFSVETLPPLNGELGEILIGKPHAILLGQAIKGVELEEPLFAVITTDAQREAVLFGTDLWKWRMQAYQDNKDFKNFDEVIGKVIFYLSNNSKKKRLNLDYERVFENSAVARISARYFDKAFELDRNASLILRISGKDNQISTERPMLLKDDSYEVNLSDFPPGDYTFTVTVTGEDISASGSFGILDFNLEQQLLSSDYKKLNQLALNTNGKLFFPEGASALLDEIIWAERYAPVQKRKENVVSLIDFRILLIFITIFLAMEWFIRKYNGLI